MPSTSTAAHGVTTIRRTPRSSMEGDGLGVASVAVAAAGRGSGGTTVLVAATTGGGNATARRLSVIGVFADRRGGFSKGVWSAAAIGGAGAVTAAVTIAVAAAGVAAEGASAGFAERDRHE